MFHAIGIITVVCAIYWVLNKRPADGGPSVAEKLVGILLLTIPLAGGVAVLFAIWAVVTILRQLLLHGG